MKRWLIRMWNAARGYRFDWIDGTLAAHKGTCPYPVSNDWSAKHCIASGNCGCDEKCK